MDRSKSVDGGGQEIDSIKAFHSGLSQQSISYTHWSQQRLKNGRI
jgi:hypothetical protein